MEKLTDDLSALILNKKLAADAMSLAVYNECGALFFLTRNMSDPSWFVHFTVPTSETVRHMCEVCETGNVPKVTAEWIQPILARNETTLKFLVKKKLTDFRPGMSHCLTYIYTQGGDATPPPFAELGGCGNSSPTADARALAVRKYYRNSYHGIVNYEPEFDLQNYDQEDLAEMINVQFDDIMEVIRALVAEA
jgi:hypothetical protein